MQLISYLRYIFRRKFSAIFEFEFMILFDSSIFTLCKIYDFKFNLRSNFISVKNLMQFFSVIIMMMMMRGFIVAYFLIIMKVIRFDFIYCRSIINVYICEYSELSVICMVISAEMNYAYILLLLPSSYSLQRCIFCVI